MISYRSDVRPGVDAIAAVYRAAPLFRPVLDTDRIQRMYDGSNVVVTAWDGDRLVGILRGLTDGAYDGYVCDLAIHSDYQGQGVGRGLLDEATKSRPDVSWMLRASQIAIDYYSHIGWQKVENGWSLPGRRLNLETEWDGPPRA